MANVAPDAEWYRVVKAPLAVLAYLVVLGTLWWSSAPVAANGNSLGTKSVDVDSLTTRFDAVTISKVTVAGQEIQPGRSSGAKETTPGTPFQADEDWLKNMSIFIKNRTDIVIVCVEVDLEFPDTGDGKAQPVTEYIVRVGQLPEWAQYYRDGTKMPPDPTKKPLLLTPGKTLEIQVADFIDQIQAAVEDKLPFQQITRVNISRDLVYFRGGMRWHGSSYEVPVTDRLGYYTKLAADYFPGNALQYPARE
jgi:hypothetical protein